MVNRKQPVNLTALGNAGAGLIANKATTYLSEKAHINKGISNDIGAAFGGGITAVLTRNRLLAAGETILAPETGGASFAVGSLMAGGIELGSQLFSSVKL